MAELFSVAGSAVGVISLGLMVSQGFLAYYGPYKSFHEEIETVTTRVEALKRILTVIQTLTTEANLLNCPSVAQSTQIAKDTILSCKSALQKLQGVLNRLCASTPLRRLPTAEVKAHINRLLYPFRRETLISVIENVSWLQDNLNTSLQILQISLAIVGHNRMQSILKKSTSMALDTNCMARAIQQQDQDSESINHGLVRIERRLDKMESRTMAPSTSLIADSDLLQSLLSKQQNLDTAIAAPGSAAHIRRRHVLFHNNGCLLHAPGKRTINLLMKRTLCNRLLRFSVLASLQITIGAGGFAISPKLEFRPVVPEDSPIFILLRSVRLRFKEDSNRSLIRDANRRLFELFREGKASPSDTLADGSTILHIVTSWQYYTCQWDADLLEDWRRLINELLDTGLSPSQIDYSGRTPADNMIDLYETFWDGHGEPVRESATLAICSDLLKAGGHMTNNALDWRHRPNTLNPVYYMYPRRLFEEHTVRLVWLLEDSRGLQDIDLPEELVPLITRSKDHLLLLLKKKYDMQGWIDSYAQWPTGLCLLLQAGYNPVWQPFRRACEANCIASLRILINNRNFRLGRFELEIASVHYNKDIVQLTLQALVDRRKRLQSLAAACLPSEVLAQLQIRPDCLLNLKAAKAYKLLKLYSIKVDDIEEESEWSVYDAVGDNLSIADQLWYAGFQDVDELDDCGETGLMRLEWSKLNRLGPGPVLEKACWMISKGAGAHRKKSSSPALHFLGHAIGDSIFFIRNDEDARTMLSCLDKECWALFRSILCDDTKDNCDCSCSVDGCCGLTRVLGGLHWRRDNTSTQSLIQGFSVTIDFAASFLELNPRELFYNQLAPGVFRFLTFHMLDLTHTCTHHYRNIEPEEAAEVHDEQRYLIWTLERLVNELTVEFEKSTEPLPEFLTGYCWKRINEAISARDTPTQQELDKLYQTGVVFWGYNDAMF
ncbi:hypothetical protein ASPVEDRAFT_73591 [Aspergillus versicolor CBS 583.65]|uniref:Fungal N-terminal domain-containing protein n=1 Tax=Aspergillus versicolor CBS 583.65 TaxID=1036611 RepID=A0A1L9PR90_ASPVE|nr:uncharacterized protein ASPVEDRAFT_73591 [Aspergillus versicolor CBS 583.65]OJJ04023.1 hypothetical protein ASPVEDRAFT_73591 [Aspergillus versicolor CBS 583.65]